MVTSQKKNVMSMDTKYGSVNTHNEFSDIVLSDEAASENVCRLHVHTRIFDWTQPPNRKIFMHLYK